MVFIHQRLPANSGKKMSEQFYWVTESMCIAAFIAPIDVLVIVNMHNKFMD